MKMPRIVSGLVGPRVPRPFIGDRRSDPARTGGEIFGWDGANQNLLLDTTMNISSFGEDQAGEVYVVNLGGLGEPDRRELVLHVLDRPDEPELRVSGQRRNYRGHRRHGLRLVRRRERFVVAHHLRRRRKRQR